MSYDVVIAGAGIPGLYAARELARSGKRVVILDRSEEPGEPNYSTAGIPIGVLEEFALPREGINEEITRFLLGTRNKEVIKLSEPPVGYVLDFKKTKILLAEGVSQAEGLVKWGVCAEELIMEGNRFAGVKTDTEDFLADYIIDATGAEGNLSEQAGLREEVSDKISVGTEYIIRAKGSFCQKYRQTLGLYLDTKLAPYGYAWVFANGGGTYKVGVIEYWVDPKRRLTPIDDRLDLFLDWLGREYVEGILEKHGGSMFLTTNFPRVSKNNLLAIGDVIGGVSPLFAEGIRHGLYTARFAVEAILSDDGTGRNLGLYEQKWKKYKGLRWKITELVSRYLLFGRQSQRFFEAIIDYVQKNLTAQDIVEVGFEYKLGCVRKDIRGFVKGLLSVACHARLGAKQIM